MMKKLSIPSKFSFVPFKIILVALGLIELALVKVALIGLAANPKAEKI